VTQPAPLTQWTPELRNVAHPDLSQVLIHFCDRARPLGRDIPEEILGMSPPERLTSILWDGHLRVFVTDSGGDPVVCFTESTWRGLDYVIGERSRAPWGVIFERQSVYDAGGGPTWHARPEEHQALGQLSPRLRSWAVRLDPGSDWLQQREWRIPREPGAAVALCELRLVGLLVGDPRWTGARWEHCVSAATGQHQWGSFFPPLPSGLPRYWWDPRSAQLQQLPPLFGRDLEYRTGA
jgi:hypothetical protein